MERVWEGKKGEGMCVGEGYGVRLGAWSVGVWGGESKMIVHDFTKTHCIFNPLISFTLEFTHISHIPPPAPCPKQTCTHIGSPLSIAVEKTYNYRQIFPIVFYNDL